ncbi:uncharacterized protein LOC126676537 isoform X2 [Mercurialis annua]|nr:uncharacterized protein LOC126676537 isoform X2 [Mercurialis annua]
MMAYIFNAMIHLAVEVRLTAFKFFDLVVQHHPPAFSVYAEKVLQNYGDILRKNQFYLEDKGKLKDVLAGLVRCLSLLPSNITESVSIEKKVIDQKMLHAFEPDMPTESAEFPVIFSKIKDLLPILVSCFQDFIPLIHSMPSLDAQSFDCMLSILRSIDLVVRFLVYGTDKGNSETHHSLWDPNTLSVSLKKLFAMFPLNPVHHLSEKDDDRYFSLNIMIAETFLQLSERIYPPAVLLEKFLAFIEHALLGKVWSDTRSGRAAREKQIITLIPFIPKLVAQVTHNWKSRLLQAFKKIFLDSCPESPAKMVCLAAIEEMLFSGEGILNSDVNASEITDHQVAWIRELPLLLILLGDSHDSSSQTVLHLLLRLGQCSISNSFLALEYDNIQYSLQSFYCTYEKGNWSYGPFIKLSRESQELALCCLYYFSHLDPLLLKSIASCCFSPELDTLILFRMIEVFHSAYKAGHVQIADHISFLVTVVSCFRVVPENLSPLTEDVKTSNRGTLKSLGRVVCSCLSEMGDNSLVLLILERIIIQQILSKPPLDNANAMIRMLVALDSKPTRLSEQNIVALSNFLPRYLIDVVHNLPGDDGERMRRYFLLPCFFLLDRSHKLLTLVLNVMSSLIIDGNSLSSGDRSHYTTSHSVRIKAIVSVLLLMHRDTKIKQLISSLKSEVDLISQNICSLQTSEAHNLSVGERLKIQSALDQLRTMVSSLPQEMQIA